MELFRSFIEIMNPHFSNRFFFGLLFFVYWLVLAVGGTAQASEIGAARVVKVEGLAFVLDGLAGERVSLRAGDSVGSGATLVTEAKSRLVLLFSNGAAMTLGPLTAMNIEEYLHEGTVRQLRDPNPSTTSLFLEYGEVSGNVEGLDSRSEFNVRTPLGTAGIRGTTFRISFDSSTSVLTISNAQGSVEWVADGVTTPITGGQQLIITASRQADGSWEVLQVVSSGIEPGEVRVIVQSLIDGITARVTGTLREGQLAPYLLSPGAETIRISPSR